MVKDTKRVGKIALFDKALVFALACGALFPPMAGCLQCGSAIVLKNVLCAKK